MAHYLCHVLVYVYFSFKKHFEYKLLSFVNQYAFRMFVIFCPPNIVKIVYCFESRSFQPLQGSRAIHFTMLAPCQYVSTCKSGQMPQNNLQLGTTNKGVHCQTSDFPIH